jgi:hypothetical protein
MPTTTNRALPYPSATAANDVPTDMAALAAAVDTALGPSGGRMVIVCTSATRPSSPVEGLQIYETDTDKVYIYSGTAWVQGGSYVGWESYTPTWSGTKGNGTLSGWWTRQGRSIDYYIKLVWGSSTTHPASINTFTLPVAVHARYTDTIGILGEVAILDFGTATFTARAYKSAASSSSIQLAKTGGLTQGDAAVTNTVPMTFTTNDEVHILGRYESLT